MGTAPRRKVRERVRSSSSIQKVRKRSSSSTQKCVNGGGRRRNKSIQVQDRGHHKLRGGKELEDPFSRLPDDMIVDDILSRLPLKDRAIAGAVSCRWQNLWVASISIAPKLTLQGGKRIINFIRDDEKNIKRTEEVFVGWVNHILKLHKSPTLEDFRVHFDASQRQSDSIDGWLDSVFAKGVKRLELDLTCSTQDYHYTLKIDKVEKKGSFWWGGFRNLRELSLKFVQVDQKVIEYMLWNCPFLERLCLWHTKIRDLMVCSVGLRSMEFVTAHSNHNGIGYSVNNLESIEINSAPNLTSLMYSGPRGALHLGHVPVLSELSIGWDYCRAFLKMGCTDFSYISQLKVLVLDMPAKLVQESVDYPLEFPTFPKLEQLEVHMHFYSGLTLMWPIVLIQAAPLLHTFILKAVERSYFGCSELENCYEIEKWVRIENVTRRAHPNLRVIILREFKGESVVYSVCKYLILHVAKSLQKVVVMVGTIPGYSSILTSVRCMGSPPPLCTQKEMDLRCALRNFDLILPDGARLVIN